MPPSSLALSPVVSLGRFGGAEAAAAHARTLLGARGARRSFGSFFVSSLPNGAAETASVTLPPSSHTHTHTHTPRRLARTSCRLFSPRFGGKNAENIVVFGLKQHKYAPMNRFNFAIVSHNEVIYAKAANINHCDFFCGNKKYKSYARTPALFLSMFAVRSEPFFSLPHAVALPLLLFARFPPNACAAFFPPRRLCL